MRWKAAILTGIVVVAMATAGCTSGASDGTTAAPEETPVDDGSETTVAVTETTTTERTATATTTEQPNSEQSDEQTPGVDPGNVSEEAREIREQAITASSGVNRTQFRGTLDVRSALVNASVEINGAVDRDAERIIIYRNLSNKNETWFSDGETTYLHTMDSWQGGYPALLVENILLDLQQSLLDANHARLIETRTIDERRVHVLEIEPSEREVGMTIGQFGQYSMSSVDNATLRQYVDAKSKQVVGMRLNASNDFKTVNVSMRFKDVGEELRIPTPEGLDESADEQPEQVSSVVGNITKFNVSMPQFADRDSRQVRVYTPPGYNESDRHYPVVYMQDGQNLYDNETAYNVEWGADETMQRLHEQQNRSAIVVGIDNAASHEARMAEYLPWEHEDLGGKGDTYATWMAETLNPEIDDRYRTRPDETVVAGSSVGGVISVYTAFEYPEQFPYAAGMSTSVWTAPDLREHVNTSTASPERVYLDWGTAEGTAMAAPNERLIMVLEANGYEKGESLLVERDEGADHTEAAWRERFPRALLWLLTGDDPEA